MSRAGAKIDYRQDLFPLRSKISLNESFPLKRNIDAPGRLRRLDRHLPESTVHRQKSAEPHFLCNNQDFIVKRASHRHQHKLTVKMRRVDIEPEDCTRRAQLDNTPDQNRAILRKQQFEKLMRRKRTSRRMDCADASPSH